MYFNVPNYPTHLIRTDVKAVYKEKEVEDRSKMRLSVMQKQEEQRTFERINEKPTCSELEQEFKKLEDHKSALNVVEIDQKKKIVELKKKIVMH